MKDYKQIAQKLLTDLQNSSYFVWADSAEGLEVQVWRNPDKICFEHNLGGFHVPTKKEAEEMLFKIKKHAEELCAASTELVEFIDGRTIEIGLMVSSGHMDFSVATLLDGEITWFTNLE